MQLSKQHFRATILHGDQHGRTIGFPTINMDPELWSSEFQPGVYASRVTISGETYIGALYFGPRTIKSETKNVLEITLLDFSAEIYDQVVVVEVGDFIRAPIVYEPGSFSEAKLQQQIASDVAQIQKLNSQS
ncbi:riboflavin kinase [Candidatus Woesebacteria bacterium]|nr:riboflavin kinase [Candidatus Woesebacteria bacterium]